MALSSGTRLGQFEIAELVGVGGMGEVYRATDTTLGRDVAIKVLPEVFSRDADRLARFKREARLLASLDHPNICAVHDLQEADGAQFMVMPFLEGETLSARIGRGPVPVDEALPMFAQIAEALEAAHEQGIIHRDLKPGNIMVTDDGKVKVLDFGLGKAIEPQTVVSGEATTRAGEPDSAKMSQEGVVLGTPVYMSPEQARGKLVDKRTDIWAFGCCLYEALTGNLPFQGETVSDTLARVLERDPDWERLPSETPAPVRALLRKCLQKDSNRRLRDIGDARIDMQDLITESGRVQVVTAEAATPPGRLYALAAAVVFGAVLIAGALYFALKPGPPSPGLSPGGIQASVPPPKPNPIHRYSILLPETHPLHSYRAGESTVVVAISPDGMVFVYVAAVGPTTQLVLRRMDQRDIQPMAGTDGASSPFFSPDGEWIGFFAQNKLKKISVQGGAPMVLCDTGESYGASWGDDDFIVFSPGIGGELKRISAAGGAVEDLPTKFRDRRFLVAASPTILPGSETVLFTLVEGMNIENIHIAALSLNTGEVTLLVERAMGGIYHPTGHLVYSREGVLMAEPFDPDTLAFTGAAVPVTEPDMTLIPIWNAPIAYTLAADGTFIYSPAPKGVPQGIGNRMLVWVDRQGRAEPLAVSPGPYTAVHLSPDGGRVVVDETDMTDLWIHDLTRASAPRQRATFGAGLEYAPCWTPDGQHIVFGSMDEGQSSIAQKAADGTGAKKSLYTTTMSLAPTSITPDGKSLVFMKQGSGTVRDLWILSLEGEASARPLLEESFSEVAAAFSPDGRWLAYGSDESGSWEVYVRPFPDVDTGKWLISTEGGTHPIWSPDGKELFYRNADAMMAVDIETEPAFRPGNPRTLFKGDYHNVPPYYVADYDISPDGKRFLMIMDNAQSTEDGGIVASRSATEFVVVVNWDEKLKAIRPAEKP